MLFRSVLSMEEAAGACVLRRPRGHLCWVLRRRYIWGILEVRIDRAKRRVPPAGHVRGTVGPRAVTLTTALACGTVRPGAAPPVDAGVARGGPSLARLDPKTGAGGASPRRTAGGGCPYVLRYTSLLYVSQPSPPFQERKAGTPHPATDRA